MGTRRELQTYGPQRMSGPAAGTRTPSILPGLHGGLLALLAAALFGEHHTRRILGPVRFARAGCRHSQGTTSSPLTSKGQS